MHDWITDDSRDNVQYPVSLMGVDDNGMQVIKDVVQIREGGKLYIEGKEVVTRQEVALNKWVNAAVIIGAASTLIIASVAVYELLRGSGVVFLF
jgi:hypothetical protein